MVVVTSNERDVIFDAVRAMYTAVADQPEEEYHFPTGRGACEYVGYPAEHLDRLPQAALESFAGVGYPFAADVLRENDDVLDIGSGSGTDLLLASLLVGPGGRAVGLDMTEAMRRKAAENARAAVRPASTAFTVVGSMARGPTSPSSGVYRSSWKPTPSQERSSGTPPTRKGITRTSSLPRSPSDIPGGGAESERKGRRKASAPTANAPTASPAKKGRRENAPGGRNGCSRRIPSDVT